MDGLYRQTVHSPRGWVSGFPRRSGTIGLDPRGSNRRGVRMNKMTARQLANVLAVAATLVVNILANALPLNGLNTGEISDRFKVYFVPAGYVFSIWGLIYLGLVAFAIYQALPRQRDNLRLARVGYLFVLACAANIAWLFLWHYEQFPLTLLAMAALLVFLIMIYLRLGIGRVGVVAPERWCVQIPFSVYLSWITVATIANVTSLLDYLRWDGWGIAPEVWAVIMLLVAAGVAAAVGWTRGDAAYMLVIVWAFAGIAAKQQSTPVVATTAWAASGLVVVMILVGWARARSKRIQAGQAA